MAPPARHLGGSFWQNEAKKGWYLNGSGVITCVSLEQLDENGGGPGVRLRKRHQKKG
jgi:hypothetical protein